MDIQIPTERNEPLVSNEPSSVILIFMWCAIANPNIIPTNPPASSME
jgi:hypothetical protein